MTSSVLALDIGGANLKAAHSGGGTRLVAFPLWKNPAGLADALRALTGGWPAYSSLAVTMTGELCDCYPTKRQGVLAILDAVAAIASVPVLVWQNDGKLVDIESARAQPLLTAAANWLALATFVGRLVPTGPALLLDIGSTTTDIVPILDGQPVPLGRSDPERLRCGELVYLGTRRTPLCALLGTEGAAEFFATVHDLFLVLRLLPEDSGDCDTADGRPATSSFAGARLARMICADVETCSEHERNELAVRLLDRLLTRLVGGLETVAGRLPSPPRTIVVSGSGEFLAPMIVERLRSKPGPSIVSFAERIGKERSTVACACALAVLASQLGE
jgi:probable H4MPT-linked C1 transfer pathway protein